MRTDFSKGLASINEDILTPLVRKALMNDDCSIYDFTYEPLSAGGGIEFGGAYGLCRFAGKAAEQGVSCLSEFPKLCPIRFLLSCQARDAECAYKGRIEHIVDK